MKRLMTVSALLALAAATQANAQASDPGPNAPVSYDVRFDNAAHHEARISVTYRDLNPGPVTFRMARSSPGRYAVHEFAKNVYSVSAVDGHGKAVPIIRRDPYSWSVADHNGEVTISYTLYGDHGDGTYAQIDPTHAHLNMPATFLWAVGYGDRPIRVTYHPLHADWKVATQMPAAKGAANTFWAPNFQYFMDSPTEISDFQMREWQVPAPDGKDYNFRLAVHSEDDPAAVDHFAEMAKAVTAQHMRLFGGPPPLDFGTYTFIADYMPQIDGDGMEHRNSTMISQPRSLKEADYAQIGTLSHEFVHAWNVERLRPDGIEPFDFTQANSTRSLWFAEGFTQYYGPLLIHRAGEMSLDDFLKSLGGTLNYIVNAPGRRYGSPQEMSLRAPFVDAATAIDPVNGNIFTSYYPYGAIVGLALDLTLRERYHSSLDAYMRHMWKRNGAAQVDYAPAEPYTPDDLQAGLAELTGDAAFAKQFFDASIRGSSLPDFAPLLAPAGLTLRPAHPQKGWLGASRVEMADDALTLGQIPLPDSPLYKAGVDKGDVLVSMDGQPLASADGWNTATGALKPGQSVKLVYRNRDGQKSATLKAVADPSLEVVASESIGGTLTAAQQAFRADWLGSGE